jgi:hypothetical protein
LILPIKNRCPVPDEIKDGRAASTTAASTMTAAASHKTKRLSGRLAAFGCSCDFFSPDCMALDPLNEVLPP